MKVFPKFNNTTKCLICGTNKDGEAVLIPIDGTGDGGICESAQIHLECLELHIHRVTTLDGTKVIYQNFVSRQYE